MLGVAAAAMGWVRGQIDQSHVALTLLLVVLGGSAGGGRPLGFALALLSFLLIDYYFQPPFDRITVAKPLDWVVLIAFLAAAFVATELLTRAREESESARRRGDEIASLSVIGAQTLRHARPEDALIAITRLVQETLGVRRAAIRLLNDDGSLVADEVAASGEGPLTAEARVMELVAAEPERGTLVAAEFPDGSIARGNLDAVAEEEPIIAVVIPLAVESRRLGLMLISCYGHPRWLDGATRRFVGALSYYAALGAERVRLSKEAEHATLLREESRAKDEVLATVSHDLRTPLTAIKLLARRASERGEPSASAIEYEADRLADFVTNVLDLSRIRAGGLSLDLQLNTAEDLVSTAIRRSSAAAPERRVVAEMDLDVPALVGRFDFVHSLRALGNLIDNALRYTPPDAAVEVRTSREDGWIVIRVADRGPGIPATEEPRIFQPFYRPRGETPDSGHAGLGLSIARRLAEIQGGRLRYARREGGGSLFTLLLPAAEEFSVVEEEKSDGLLPEVARVE
jgi:two-component system sensor histidine kinase KdpD